MNESEKQLNAIKETLFFKCASRLEDYLAAKKQYDEFSGVVGACRIFYEATIIIIEECGLIDEYVKWKRERRITRVDDKNV